MDHRGPGGAVRRALGRVGLPHDGGVAGSDRGGVRAVVRGQTGSAVALAPLVLAWGFAPAVVAWVGQPMRDPSRVVSAVARFFLRRTARKTWSYRDLSPPRRTTTSSGTFQDDPVPLVAHRTSPTNMGLALLANFAALDLGYLGLRGCVERLERALSTMEKLALHRGHLLNWYDTSPSSPPSYVSTVDSGNLSVGCSSP